MALGAWSVSALPVSNPFSLPASDALQNQFDSIDLSDNAIARLEGFPKLLRLKVLHLNNNRVNKIGRNLEGVPCGGRGVTADSLDHISHTFD